jgi:hypothetical protein
MVGRERHVRRFPLTMICPECTQDAPQEEDSGRYACPCGVSFDYDTVNGDGTYKPLDWEETEEE